LKGVNCYQIEVSLKRNTPHPNGTNFYINGIRAKSYGEELQPEEIYCNGILQDKELGYYPFGKPLEMYATCEFESAELFARKNAVAKLSFEYELEDEFRQFVGYEEEVYYGLLRKAGLDEKKPTEITVEAQRVLFEYLSETGWKNVPIKGSREAVATIFTRHSNEDENGNEIGNRNGNRKEIGEINFTVPTDMLDAAHALGQARMRIRLLRADKLYQMPARIRCPKMQNLSISYMYEDDNAIKPSLVVTDNDLIEEKYTGSMTLFTRRLEEEPAIYLGFDRNPWEGTNNPRLSLYFKMENDSSNPVGFTIGCVYKQSEGEEKDFKRFERNENFTDNTKKMRDPGTLLLGVKQKRNVNDLERISLFGHELYWIRILKNPPKKDEPDFIPPRITGIFLNMVRVKNLWTQTQEFDLHSSDGILQTRGRNLISVVLEVNEENGRDDDNWVRWRLSTPSFGGGGGGGAGMPLHEERTYSIIDASAGLIRISKTALARYPVKTNGDNVRVTYETYRGELANVNRDKPAGNSWRL
jgi:hypothetical protein